MPISLLFAGSGQHQPPEPLEPKSAQPERLRQGGDESRLAHVTMGWGGTGENQNHSSRVTPDNPAFQRLAELEGTLPLTSKPTTSSCSSRNQDQGHRAGWWQSWNEKLHTRWLRHPGVWSPGYHPGRAWLPGCRESCGALGVFLLQTTPGLFGERLGAWP